MSENATTEAKTFTQDELNAVVQDRLARQAKKYEDYDDLKAKVQSYEASLSTSESEMADLKAQVASLSAKAAATEREALVSRVARDNGITDSEDIALFLTGETEDVLAKQAQRLSARNTADAEAAQATQAAAARNAAHVSTEGTVPPAAKTSGDDAFALAIAEALGQAQ